MAWNILSSGDARQRGVPEHRFAIFGRVLPAVLAAAASLLLAAAAAADPSPVRLLHAPAAVRATLTDPASIEPFLDGYAAAAMADQYPPGMMVAVATKDAVFVKAYGTADMTTGARATPETLFRVASISKTFIWTAVMMLEDEGRLDLDADVNSYLKTVKVKPKFGKPVTMNDLMAHRAGFEDTLGDFFQSGKDRSIEEALIKTRPARVAPPRARTAYSNWGADLAAQVVADISGTPYDDFVSTRILAPLGMVSTLQHDPAAIAGKALNPVALDERLASPHKLDAGAPVVMRHDALEPLIAAGAIALDAHDAGRWLRFFLNDGVSADGKRLLSPEAFTLMRLRAFRDRTGAPDLAHGFMETEIAGHRTFGHGGTLSGFIADMTIAPTLGLGVLVVVNGAEPGRLADLVSRAVIEQFAGAPSYPSRPPAAADEMKKAAASVAGVYLGNRRVWTKFERIAALGQDVRIAARDDGSLVVTAYGVSKRYYPLQADIWTDRSRDKLFVYRNKNGSVARIALGMGTDTAEPAAFLQSSAGLSAAFGLVAVFSLFAFAGAWRRQGRDVEQTALGGRLAAGHAAAAAIWLLFIGALAFVTADLGGKELADLQEIGWPPASLLGAQIAAHVAALVALIAAAAVIPVFARSGWSVWRKAHYTLFAAAGLFAVYEMWAWRVIFSANSGG